MADTEEDPRRPPRVEQPMPRPLFLTVLFLVSGLMIVGLILVMSGCSGEPEEEPAEAPVAGEPAQPQPPAGQPRPAPVASGEVAPALAAWAEGVRAAGYDVVLVGGAEGSLARIEIGVGGAYPWRWTGDDVRVDGVDADAVTAEVRGPQTLSWPMPGGEEQLAFTSEMTRVAIDVADGGGVATAVIDLAGLRSETVEGEEPYEMEEARLVLTRQPGEGALPGGSLVTLAGEGLVLPAERVGPLGRTIESFSATLTFQRGLANLAAEEIGAWREAERLMVTDLAIDWGLLSLSADGTLGLDAMGRPEGRLTAEITNFLPALDAMAVVLRLSPEIAAPWFAVMIEDRAAGEQGLTPLALEFRDGQMLLVSDDGGAAPLPIGSIGPLMAVAQ